MLARAWQLLDTGDGTQADAILEFLPEETVEALFDEYFDEVSPPVPTSTEAGNG